MFFDKNIWVVDLREYPFFFTAQGPVKQLERWEMEVGSMGWRECSLYNGSQFVVEQSWNSKCAWGYATGTRRNFNVDVCWLERVEKGGFLLCSVTLLILSCCVEASQIFKFEIGFKKNIIYQTIDLSVWLGGWARILPVHKHFDWFISMNKSRRWGQHGCRFSSSNLVDVPFGNKGVGIVGGSVKVFLQQAKEICGNQQPIVHNQTQTW